MKKEDLKKLVTSTVKEMSVTGGTATATAGTGEQAFTPVKTKHLEKEAAEGDLKIDGKYKIDGKLHRYTGAEKGHYYFVDDQSNTVRLKPDELNKVALKEKDKEPKLAAGKIKDNYAVSHFGFTPAPSVPDRKSKMMDYKSLWEEEPVDETILRKTAEKLEKLRADHRDIYDDIMDKIRNYIIDAYPHDEEIETIISKDLQAAGLNENYARFRNQNAKKNGPEQLHTAIKEIKKKLQEVDRLLEYTQRLKSEITEGSEGFKYKVHTERALEQVTETIKQLYIKNKKLK